MTTRADRLIPRLFRELQAQLGLTPQQAQGVIGNLAHESEGFSDLTEDNPIVPGSRGGYGIAQWTGPRRRQFEAWARQNGLNPESDDAQVGFLVHELQTTENAALNALQRAQTAEEAARIVSDRYLRPGIPHMESRLAWTAQLADQAVPGNTPNFRGFEGMSLFDALQAYAPNQNPVDTARQLFPGEIPAWAPGNRVEQELRGRTLGEQNLGTEQQQQITQALAPPQPVARPARLGQPTTRQVETYDARMIGANDVPGSPVGLDQWRAPTPGMAMFEPETALSEISPLYQRNIGTTGPSTRPRINRSAGGASGGTGEARATAGLSPATAPPSPPRRPARLSQPNAQRQVMGPPSPSPVLTPRQVGTYTEYGQTRTAAPALTPQQVSAYQQYGQTRAAAPETQPAWLASFYGGTAPTSQPAPLSPLDPMYRLQDYPVAGLPPVQLLPQRQQQRPVQQDPVRDFYEWQASSGGGRGSGSEGGGRTTAQSMTNAYRSVQEALRRGARIGG